MFAIDHLHILRQELFRMISWQIGIKYGFTFSLGKNYKFIDQYILEELWRKILATYRMNTYEYVWESMFLCHEIFRQAANKVGTCLCYTYPEYDKNISRYVLEMYHNKEHQ